MRRMVTYLHFIPMRVKICAGGEHPPSGGFLAEIQAEPNLSPPGGTTLTRQNPNRNERPQGPNVWGENTPSPATQRRRRQIRNAVFWLVVALVAVVFMVLVTPSAPISRATFSIGGDKASLEHGTANPLYRGLVISEIMSSNRAAVPDENGDFADWVEIWNASDHHIDMKGVGLSDKGDSIRFLFPDITLPPDGRVVVFCSDTNQSAPGQAFHAKFKLSSVGEAVYLYDPGAFLIHQVTVPIMAADESYALQPDGSFLMTAEYSPGYPNDTAGYGAFLASITVEDGAIVINEIMADPLTGMRDEDGELSDWIELYNTTSEPVSLKNLALSDSERRPLKWRFPEDAVIPANGYYVVFCSGKDRRTGGGGIPHTNFRISAEHETIVLSDSMGRLKDRVTIDNLAEDTSWGRDEWGNYAPVKMPTPGLPNNLQGRQQADLNLRAMNPSRVIISEVMASNDSTPVIDTSTFVDWVELYNDSDVAVDLSSWGFSDNLGRARKWQFPPGTMIQPRAYLTILCDGKANASTPAQPHTSFRISRMEGEILCLADPQGNIWDKLVLPTIPTNVSYGRTLGRAGFFYYKASTPNALNGDGFTGYATAPVLSAAPGLHYQTVYTTISIPEGTQVFYTNDGSEPGGNSTLYNGETLELNRTTVIRARAFSTEGLEPSDITTATYFINIYHTLPVVSLVVDPYELYNPENGLLTVGENVIKDKIPFKNTIYREFGKIGRPGHVEFYLLDGTQALRQGMEVELQGQYSLDMPQKTFKLRAKSLYGAKLFNYPLFDDRPFTEYKSFVLRNSGNDNVWTRLLDGFQSRLLDAYGSTVIHQAWNPVVVYLNGRYWGHYNMRERVDRFFVAQHEGISLRDADNMTILEANGKVKWGTRKEYRDMIAAFKKLNTATNEADMQYIADRVDLDNFIEYTALEMFFGNSDPGNIRYYKLNREGAKWKYIFYDADYGLFESSFNSPASYTKPKGMGQQKINNTILLKLLDNPTYRDMFLTKLGHIFQTFTTEYMLAVLEPMVEEIKPEMQLHWSRWGEENDPAIIAEAPRSADGAYRYWETRIQRLRNVVKKRPNLFWGMVQDTFKLSQDEMLRYFGPRPEMPADAV